MRCRYAGNQRDCLITRQKDLDMKFGPNCCFVCNYFMLKYAALNSVVLSIPATIVVVASFPHNLCCPMRREDDAVFLKAMKYIFLTDNPA